MNIPTAQNWVLELRGGGHWMVYAASREEAISRHPQAVNAVPQDVGNVQHQAAFRAATKFWGRSD